MEEHARPLEPILIYALVDRHFLDKIANFKHEKKSLYFKTFSKCTINFFLLIQYYFNYKLQTLSL
jgi:hypothetical protein